MSRLMPAGLAAMVAITSSCNCNRPPPKDPVILEGQPCTDDILCETGLCESINGAARLCVRKCTTGCRALEVCTPLTPERLGCVPELAGLCKTCTADTDCPYPGDKCIVLGGANFCGRDCTFDADSCPSSFRCADGVGLTGEAVPHQCQPVTGTCACIATTTGQTVPCEAANAVGRCIGVKVCEPPMGYGQCSAKTPAAETCNGLDDNCDGMIDNGLGDLSCGQGECAKATAACANGIPQTCTPGAPTVERCDGKDNDCNGVVDNGFDTMNDVGNCGSCGFACVVTNAVPKCELGKCGVLQCLPGFTDRDGVAANGCEYICTPVDGGNGGAEVCDGLDNDCNGIVDDGFNLVSDSTNCGQCGLTCNVSNGGVASYVCVARVCGIGQCVPGRGNCNQVYVDGCETNTGSDLANCGACGAACNPAHATGACGNGTCSIAACAPGWSNCNGQVADGCEVNTGMDPQNCGTCGNACVFANATGTCSAGTCGLTCLANWWNVDNNIANGCEYACVPTNNGVEKCDAIDNNCNGVADEGFNTTTDVNNCGACGSACSAPFTSTLACSASTCSIVTCQPSRGNCNNVYVDGCETNTSNSLAHCGACNSACATPHATPVCNSGACAISTCDTGYRDCNGTVPDGCEIDSRSNVAHCGACNNVCNLAFATPVCTAGTCQVGACLPGHWNVDGLATNGCEYACVPSGFEVCDGADNDCNGVVDDGFNLATNPLHCGACNNVCNASQGATYRCLAGGCGVLTCNAGFADCDGAYANGCETNTQTSTGSCGTCGNACVTANGVPACVSGTCQVGACSGTFANCNNLPADGCEVNRSNDPNHCGACGAACTFPGANATCTNGSCGFTCQPNRWDLDGNPANGCEYSCTYLSATDFPDEAFVDANCDGIDGEQNNSIFVSPAGNDANAGTYDSPKRSITSALAAAVGQSKRDVLVAAGTYTEQVSMAAGKGVYGAYQTGTWSRSNANVVTVTGSSPALLVSAANNVTLQLLGFIGANVGAASGTAYGAVILNSNNVALQSVSIRAGSGGAGNNGASGSTGGSGSAGIQGNPGCEDSGGFCSGCSQPVGGAGGTSACGRTGGQGGAPANGGATGGMGSSGVGGTPGGPGAPSQQGDWATPVAYWGGNGAPGGFGGNGTSGGNFGSNSVAGYIVAITTNGGSGGPGNGGGGGGGGGGGTTSCDSFGGSGGGGGAGGCGGTFGSAGMSGGASIAIYLWNSSVGSTSGTIATGTGGSGGNGGNGGVGGTGGGGGPINAYGGGGEQDDGSNGGRGGAGGQGGAGGAGGAGGGGPSIGIVRAGGSVWNESASSYFLGNGGSGGASLAGGGAPGLRVNVL